MPQLTNLSKRAVALQPSLTLAISARAKALEREGKNICSLSAGEPDFNTPDFIVEAAVRALRNGITKYGPAAGDPELREAISNKIKKYNGITINPDEVLITNGGKQAIYNLLQVILDPGDEVLIPSPYWLSYPEIVKLAGAVPIMIASSAKRGFAIDLNLLESSITKSTRLLILNSPNNPTGRVLKKEELEGIANILRRNPNISIMSDEIYEFIISNKEVHHSIGAIAPDLKERIYTVNGFAKGWAMTGWRIGYLTGRKEVINASIALQSQSTSNVCSFAQKGAIAALNGPHDCVLKMAEKYSERREILVKGLNNIKGINIEEPMGAFYAFPKLPEGSSGSVEFCNMALEEFGLAMIPGIAFGDDKCVRLSCAVSKSKILDGLDRLNNIILD